MEFLTSMTQEQNLIAAAVCIALAIALGAGWAKVNETMKRIERIKKQGDKQS